MNQNSKNNFKNVYIPLQIQWTKQNKNNDASPLKIILPVFTLHFHRDTKHWNTSQQITIVTIKITLTPFFRTEADDCFATIFRRIWSSHCHFPAVIFFFRYAHTWLRRSLENTLTHSQEATPVVLREKHSDATGAGEHSFPNMKAVTVCELGQSQLESKRTFAFATKPD